MRIPNLIFIFFLLASLFSPLAQASDACNIQPFVTPPRDAEILRSGLVGQWHTDFEQRLISIRDLDQHRLQYYSLEKKPAQSKELIIFLHGFPEFSWAWEKELEYFGQKMHAVALDLKGHHYSSAPDEVTEYDFVKLAWELRQIIHCLGYQNATLVGHDFGGGLAWATAMLYPDAVNALVVLNAPHIYLLGRAFLT
ncbi:MAG TPA: alpha/beta fold hydrolase, partial [Pseudomonadales bacterium]|nr:alpha/beta fold hydrolase [Pseudomonadales bacterium]